MNKIKLTLLSMGVMLLGLSVGIVNHSYSPVVQVTNEMQTAEFLGLSGRKPLVAPPEGSGTLRLIGISLGLMGFGSIATAIAINPKEESRNDEENIKVYLDENVTSYPSTTRPNISRRVHKVTPIRPDIKLPDQIEEETDEKSNEELPKTQRFSAKSLINSITTGNDEAYLASARNVAEKKSITRILELREDSAIWIYGSQGGGKTSKSGWLAAEHRKRGARVIVINPVAHAGMYEGLEVYGRGQSVSDRMKDADEGINSWTNEVERRMDSLANDRNYCVYDEPKLVLWCDEMTNWDNSPEISDLTLNRMLRATTQFLRQANSCVIFTTHGRTLKCIGGQAAAGLRESLNQQFVFINTIAKKDSSVPGGYRCAGKAKIEFLKDGEKDITSVEIIIPNWMMPPSHYDYTQIIAN